MRIKKIEDVMVCVTPYVWGSPDSEYEIRLANKLKDEIKRHVDDCKDVYVTYSVKYYCSYCGYEAEIDPVTKEPLCCQSAIDEFNEEKSHNL